MPDWLTDWVPRDIPPPDVLPDWVRWLLLLSSLAFMWYGGWSMIRWSRSYETDVQDVMDWTEEQVATVHRRLDRLGAPGPHPESPAAGRILRAPTTVQPVMRTPTTVGPLDADTGPVRQDPPQDPRGALDRPTPAQQANPTRPDWQRRPVPPTTTMPAVGPPVPSTKAGRHRAGD